MSSPGENEPRTKQEYAWDVQVQRRNLAALPTCVLLLLANMSRMFSLSDSPFWDFKECFCGLWINRTLGLYEAWRSSVQVQIKPCWEARRSISCWRHQRDTHFPNGGNWWPFDIAPRTQFNKVQLTVYIIGDNLCVYKRNTKQNDKQINTSSHPGRTKGPIFLRVSQQTAELPCESLCSNLSESINYSAPQWHFKAPSVTEMSTKVTNTQSIQPVIFQKSYT